MTYTQKTHHYYVDNYERILSTIPAREHGVRKLMPVQHHLMLFCLCTVYGSSGGLAWRGLYYFRTDMPLRS